MRKQQFPADLYKAGDKVIVQPHGENVYPRGIGYMGDTVTIKKHEEYMEGVYYYKIVEDGGNWWWCDNCFIPAVNDLSELVYNVLRGQQCQK